jgi:hypothetical protein
MGYVLHVFAPTHRFGLALYLTVASLAGAVDRLIRRPPTA